MTPEEHRTKCSVCHRVQTVRGWQHEFELDDLHEQSIFSHGYCKTCFENILHDLVPAEPGSAPAVGVGRRDTVLAG